MIRVESIGVVDVGHALASVFRSANGWKVAHLRDAVIDVVGVFDLLILGVRLRGQGVVGVVGIGDSTVRCDAASRPLSKCLSF